MMMRKRTNRCRNTVWDISVISRNKNGETLCGDQCALEWDDNDATVILSDGLGSGVKANILSTLTTTMLTTMLKGNVPIDECVTTVAETLPMCRERKLAYATFTILQTAGTRARLIQYDLLFISSTSRRVFSTSLFNSIYPLSLADKVSPDFSLVKTSCMIYSSSLSYSLSATGSSHSLLVFSPGTSMAICENQLSAAAPCQCFVLAGISTTSPLWSMRAGLPHS